MPNTKYASSSVVLSSSSPIVTIVNNQATCLSTDVAQFFGKLHKHVIRDIENLLSNLPAERRPNFGLCYENNELQNGRPLKRYRMTRDGFTLLVMGWTGVKALQFKLAWLDAFNKMEALIREGNTAAAKAGEKSLGYKFTSVAKLRRDVQAARMTLGLTCETAGSQIGVSGATISNFLNHGAIPIPASIDKYSHWLSETNALGGYYFISFTKFRHALQLKQAETGLSTEGTARRLGVQRTSLRDFLNGKQAELWPETVEKLIAWLNSFDRPSRVQIEPPQIKEPKVEPEPQTIEDAPKVENTFDPVSAWPGYQSYFLANKAKLSPEVKNAVRTLNSYFFDAAME